VLVVGVAALLVWFIVSSNEEQPDHIYSTGNYTTIVVPDDGTTVTLERSSSSTLYTLSMAAAAATGGGVVPIARTYDGHAWERAGGRVAARMPEWTCSNSSSNNKTTDDATNNNSSNNSANNNSNTSNGYNYCSNQLAAGTYFLQQRHAVSTVDPIARFLEQATFGTTRALLQELLAEQNNNRSTSGTSDNENDSVYTHFLQNQFTTPPTLLREYFRRRANPIWRFDKPEFAVRAGGDPCRDPHSYWRRTLFTVKDRDATVTFRRRVVVVEQNLNNTYWTIAVNGHIRATGVPKVEWASDNPSREQPAFEEGDYRYCSTDERTHRGEFRVFGRGACRRIVEAHLMVQLDDGDDDGAAAAEGVQGPPIIVVSETLPPLADASFWQQHLPFASNTLTADYQTKQSINSVVAVAACVPPPDNNNNYYESPPIFAKTEAGEWLMYTPRLEMRDNTLEVPLVDGGSAALTEGRTRVCANVARTLFNEAHCIPSAAACAVGSFDDTTTAATTGANNTNSTPVIMVCGSPGEVSNDIQAGDHWLDVASVPPDEKATRLGLPADTTNSRDFERQREFVWADAVLSANDQLRQRVAWALFQIFAIAKTSIRGDSYQTESFLHYYDIFVRNGLGNYLDILREVSYSPLMAENLSYLNSSR